MNDCVASFPSRLANRQGKDSGLCCLGWLVQCRPAILSAKATNVFRLMHSLPADMHWCHRGHTWEGSPATAVTRRGSWQRHNEVSSASCLPSEWNTCPTFNTASASRLMVAARASWLGLVPATESAGACPPAQEGAEVRAACLRLGSRLVYKRSRICTCQFTSIGTETQAVGGVHGVSRFYLAVCCSIFGRNTCRQQLESSLLCSS